MSPHQYSDSPASTLGSNKTAICILNFTSSGTVLIGWPPDLSTVNVRANHIP